MDKNKLEQVGKSDYFSILKELLDEEKMKLLVKPYTSRIPEEVAIEALSREKMMEMMEGLVDIIERSVANSRENSKRSFK